MPEFTEITEVTADIKGFDQQLDDMFKDSGVVGKEFQELRTFVLEEYAKEVRWRMRIRLSLNKDLSAMYPSGGGGSDYRYGGVRLYDLFESRVTGDTVTMRAGRGRPDASMYDKPKEETTQMHGLMKFPWWRTGKFERMRTVTRKGIYYFTGSVLSAEGDLQKIVDRAVVRWNKKFGSKS